MFQQVTVSTSLVRFESVSKRFPGVQALEDVSLSVKEGEILALVGENGAGKSTLIKILAGVHPDGTYRGRLYLDGEPVAFQSVIEAERSGIIRVPQDPVGVPELSVTENLFLGRLNRDGFRLNWQRLHRRARRALAEMSVEVDPRQSMGDLSIAQQQLVEVAKALDKEARLLILDEPTSSLAPGDIEILFERIREMKSRGVTVIYISHRLGEVFRLADRIAVLRDGKRVGVPRTSRVSQDEVIRMMIGRSLEERSLDKSGRPGDVRMRVKGARAHDPRTERDVLEGVSFSLRESEVLTLFGLVGSGRTELLRTVFGTWHGPSRIELEIEGETLRSPDPRGAIEAGIGFITENRNTGLVTGRSVRSNITLASLSSVSRFGIVNDENESEITRRLIDQLDISTPSTETEVETLSGGNQQKVILAKWLNTRPRVLLMDEPTRGIDVGTKFEIYRLINQLASEGMSVVFVTSEADEALRVGDRILVLYNGSMVAEFDRNEVDRDGLLAAAVGGAGNG